MRQVLFSVIYIDNYVKYVEMYLKIKYNVVNWRLLI